MINGLQKKDVPVMSREVSSLFFRDTKKIEASQCDDHSALTPQTGHSTAPASSSLAGKFQQLHSSAEKTFDPLIRLSARY